MNEKSTYKSYIAPALVLVVICLVVTAALAGTYSIQKPRLTRPGHRFCLPETVLPNTTASWWKA